MSERAARLRVCIVFAAILALGACGDSDGPPGRAGDGGAPGSSCSVTEDDDGTVHIGCDDGTSGTIQPGGGGACSIERSDTEVTLSCPDGSSVSFPQAATLPEDAGAGAGPCTVVQTEGGLTVTCPDGASHVIPTADGGAGGVQSLFLIGPAQSACIACHDSPTARAHFAAMTVAIDGDLQETCGTCHNETSLEPVSRAHARREHGSPGLELSFGAISIDPGTRKARVSLSITDSAATPISRDGLTWSFLIAKVPEQTRASLVGVPTPTPAPAPLAGPYENYLTRSVTQVDTEYFPLAGEAPRVVTLPTTERTGTFTQTGPGNYDYTFDYALPADYDPSMTHMVAAYVTRTVDGVRFVANAEKWFVPSSPAATPLVREAVSEEACNGCHNPLAAHGGSRQDLQLCLGCHTQGAIDPESGNSIDMAVMVHRIHRGRDLPSVKAGTPYQIIGNAASLHDFSHVGYPRPVEHCQSCHDTPDDRWVTNATHDACVSCHDDIYEPGVHIGALSPQATCGNANCHAPGGLPPDAREAHVTSLNNASAALFDVEILSASVASADAAPEVRIRARTGTRTTGAITPVASVDNLQTLNVFLNGPNTGYLANGNTIERIGKASLVDLTADSENPGEFTFKLPISLREAVEGLGNPELDSYTLSIRAAYDPTPTGAPDNDRIDMLKNPSIALGAAEELAARPGVVDTAKCNSCHGELRAHGGDILARNVEQCAMCHTATLDTRVRQGANQVAGITTSLRFSTLIHRVHGSHLAEQSYVVYGHSTEPPYPALNFSEVGFPGDLRDCSACHTGNSYQLPLPAMTPPTQVVALDAEGAIVNQ